MSCRRGAFAEAATGRPPPLLLLLLLLQLSHLETTLALSGFLSAKGATLQPPSNRTTVCAYSLSRSRISCRPPSGLDRVVCRVRPPVAATATQDGGPLPQRRYRLGPLYRHPWYRADYYDLFRPRADGSYWPEHAESQDYYGRRRFGLSTSVMHEGPSVLSRRCWRQLVRAIDAGGRRRRMLVHVGTSDKQSRPALAAAGVAKDYVAELVVIP